MTKWNSLRLANAAVLAGWAALFWFLIIGERVPLFLSTRTAWLAYLGAITSSLGCIGYLVLASKTPRERLTSQAAWRSAVLLFPVVLLFVAPPITLSSFAVSRRTTLAGQSFVSGSAALSEGELSLLDTALALGSSEGRQALARRAGTTVSFEGFVSREPGQAVDEFTLSRFVITCCPGDALSVRVRVVGAPPSRFKSDSWVRVTGTFYPLGTQVIVDAAEIVQIPRPAQPYLNP